MFKIPNWEDDVPTTKVDFGKTSKSKKEKKVIETVPSPAKSSNSQSLNKVAKTNKHKKKNKKSLGTNTSTVTQSIENSLSKVNNKSNNNVVKPKKKPRQNQQNTQDSVQKKQFPNKKSGNNVQAHLNGNTNQGSQDQDGQLSSTTKDKHKKKRSKKRKFKNQETTSASYTQAEENTEDNIDISEPSKPKKKKFSDDLDPSNKVPSKKKKRGNQSEDPEIVPHLSKVDKKKEKLRKILQIESNRNSINVSGNKLRERMLERLKAAQFRFLNEKLYTTSGSEAQQLFQSDPEAFQTYHQGYQQQLKKWPVNPLDLIVQRISKMPKTHTIADMGCGEAKLSKRVQQTVRSFDLVASVPGVEACDMAHTPLLSASIDAAVYCLALMGTDLTQYLVEANRILKMGGHLLIAEVESRFDKVENFTDGVQKLGFKLKNLDKSHQVFYFMEFTKVRDPPAKKSKLPALTLKPCLYKKR